MHSCKMIAFHVLGYILLVHIFLEVYLQNKIIFLSWKIKKGVQFVQTQVSHFS